MSQSISLSTPISKIKRFTKKRLAVLNRVGLKSVRDFLFYFPFRYDDFSTVTPISNLKPNQKVTVQGQITSIENKSAHRTRMIITEAIVSDDTGSIKVVWFRQPFLLTYFPKNTSIILNGKVEYSYGGLQLTSPQYERFSEDNLQAGRIVPVYSETKGLTSKWLRVSIGPLTKYASMLVDYIPTEIKKKFNLLNLDNAISSIHFPESEQELEKARDRLKFDELFLLQLQALKSKRSWQSTKSYKVPFKKKLTTEFLSKLEFELTKSQKISAWEILQDLAKEKPMNRLLEGDVGSGKTVVVFIATLQCLKANKQVALMAPTEVLASQHFISAKRDFASFPYSIAIFTRNNLKLYKSGKETNISKNKLIEKISLGKIDFIIGTHALIQENVSFKNLALSIIDEQHRFGVDQRAKLKGLNKNKRTPHLLSLTATPIPRTLALSIYGDLDLSIINELPKGRKKILTKIVAPFNRSKAYDFIREQIDAGRQAFVICPLIEESDKLGVKSATKEYEKLNKKIFPDLNISLLHGKLKKDAKTSILEDFKNKKSHILVSTSVIEVGIDIPNSTIMMIENAERFGLSQLHQFRGRVGRSHHQSYCFLFTDSNSEKTYERLNALETCQDGFKLAEIDLELRGPGEVYGLRQSGLPDLKMASLMDVTTLKKARQAATKIITIDPDLNDHPLLKQKLDNGSSQCHLE